MMGRSIRRFNCRSESGKIITKVLFLLAAVALALGLLIGALAFAIGLGGTNNAGSANTATVNGVSSSGLSSNGAAASSPDQLNSGPYGTGSDMRGYQSTLDVDALNAQLAARGSALAGHAQEIDDVARQYNLDPVVFASLIMEESGWGTNRATTQFNNCTSVMTGPDASQFRQFDSFQASMQYTANSLCNGQYYFTQGNTTLGSVGAIYAPAGASNDPNGTNAGWARDISTIANGQIPRRNPGGG